MATNATFGTVEYRDGGIVALPLTFAENVIVPSKTVLEITHVSGDALAGITYYLVGENTDYEAVFKIPQDRSGSFRISANGDVLKTATGVWDNVIASALVVSYDTSAPRIVDFDVPADYTPGEHFDVKIAYNTLVTGFSDNNVQDLFILGRSREYDGYTHTLQVDRGETDRSSYLSSNRCSSRFDRHGLATIAITTGGCSPN